MKTWAEFDIREDQKPTVIIKCGKIVGKIKETQNELEDFIAFTSIPYAEPPIGKYFFSMNFHPMFPPYLFYEFFTVWAVENKNKPFIGPKLLYFLFSGFQLKKKS